MSYNRLCLDDAPVGKESKMTCRSFEKQWAMCLQQGPSLGKLELVVHQPGIQLQMWLIYISIVIVFIWDIDRTANIV